LLSIKAVVDMNDDRKS